MIPTQVCVAIFPGDEQMGKYENKAEAPVVFVWAEAQTVAEE